MTTRAAQTQSAPYRRLATPMIDAVLRSARERAGFPSHLTYFASEPAAAARPLPAPSFGSIANRSRMGPPMAVGKRSMNGNVEGPRSFVEADELQPIRPQGNNLDGRAARITSRIRKREDEAKNLADRLKYVAKVATEKVGRRSRQIRQLGDVLAIERFEAAEARKRATALEKESEKANKRHQIACFQAGLARNALSCGWTAIHELEDKELEARVNEARAERNAKATQEQAAEAVHVANQWDRQVVNSIMRLEMAEDAQDKAERVAFRYKKKAARAARVVESFDAAQMAGGAAALLAMRAGVVEGISSCNDEQEEPKAKRARR